MGLARAAAYDGGMGDTSPSPRRRLQFSLRTLLIGVTLLAVACAIVGPKLVWIRQRHEMIQPAGGVGFVEDAVGANSAAVEALTNTTLADGPMTAHRPDAAATDPPYVADAPAPRNRTRLTNLATPDE